MGTSRNRNGTTKDKSAAVGKALEEVIAVNADLLVESRNYMLLPLEIGPAPQYLDEKPSSIGPKQVDGGCRKESTTKSSNSTTSSSGHRRRVSFAPEDDITKETQDRVSRFSFGALHTPTKSTLSATNTSLSSANVSIEAPSASFFSPFINAIRRLSGSVRKAPKPTEQEEVEEEEKGQCDDEQEGGGQHKEINPLHVSDASTDHFNEQSPEDIHRLGDKFDDEDLFQVRLPFLPSLARRIHCPVDIQLTIAPFRTINQVTPINESVSNTRKTTPEVSLTHSSFPCFSSISHFVIFEAFLCPFKPSAH